MCTSMHSTSGGVECMKGGQAKRKNTLLCCCVLIKSKQATSNFKLPINNRPSVF